MPHLYRTPGQGFHKCSVVLEGTLFLIRVVWCHTRKRLLSSITNRVVKFQHLITTDADVQRAGRNGRLFAMT